MFAGIFLAAALVPQPASVKFGEGTVPAAGVKVTYAADAGIPAEGYRLSVGRGGIVVTSSGEAGRFYAGQTSS